MVANYKVRLKDSGGDGDLIIIEAAKASKSAAETDALADGDAGGASAAVDVEKLDSSEASYRGQFTQTTGAAMAADIAQLADEVADATNSSTTELGGAGTFTGGYVSLSGYEGISVSVLVDQDSATDGLTIKWSDNGTDELLAARSSFTIAAGTDFSEQFPRRALYYRVGLVNGGVAQGTLELTTRKLPRFASVGTANSPVIVNTEISAAAALADAASNPTAGIVGAANLLFNGTTHDRQRGNTDLSILTSASRTTTQTGADQTNYNARGIKVVLDVTVPGTGSITLTIEAKDAVSGAYYTLLSGAAVTTDTTIVYTVFPGAPVSANVSANDQLPRTFRIVVTANNANAITYSVGASLLV